MIKRMFSKTIDTLLDGSRTDMRRIVIADKTQISHDTFIMRCKFDENKIVGVPLGHHLRINFEGGTLTQGRTYAPVSDLEQKGIVDILIKVYRPCKEFPEGGKMTQYLDGLKIGDEITISGPRGRFVYKSDGVVEFKKLECTRQYKKISFIAGGSGIAPIYQLLVNLKETDTTEITLLFANKSEADILLRKQLEDFAKTMPNFRFHMTIDKAASNWDYFTGYVDQNMIKQVIPKPSPDHLVWVCGPEDMNTSVGQHLIACGHSDECVVMY